MPIDPHAPLTAAQLAWFISGCLADLSQRTDLESGSAITDHALDAELHPDQIGAVVDPEEAKVDETAERSGILVVAIDGRCFHIQVYRA